MMRRTASLLCAVLAIGCNSDSGTKDLGLSDQPATGDLPLAVDGQKLDQPPTVGDLLLPREAALADLAKPADLATSPDKSGTPDAAKSCGKIRCDCYAFSTKQNKWLPLFGKANQVAVLPDFKVKVASFGGSLKVKQVTTLPLKCGEWQTVTIGATFSYQLVTLGEDFTIQYDQNFPGINTVTCPSCK